MMSDAVGAEISELERRIGAALERIGQAVEGAGAATPVEEPVQDSAQGALEAELDRLKEALDAEITANSQLRERVTSLRNMKVRQQQRISELENEKTELEKARDADREELDGLIAALEPLVKEQPHA